MGTSWICTWRPGTSVVVVAAAVAAGSSERTARGEEVDEVDAGIGSKQKKKTLLGFFFSSLFPFETSPSPFPHSLEPLSHSFSMGRKGKQYHLSVEEHSSSPAGATERRNREGECSLRNDARRNDCMWPFGREPFCFPFRAPPSPASSSPFPRRIEMEKKTGFSSTSAFQISINARRGRERGRAQLHSEQLQSTSGDDERNLFRKKKKLSLSPLPSSSSTPLH